jgi:hypothetical protein
MKSTATTLYPFLPSGPRFEESIRFFGELGFETQWQHGGIVGLRFGGAYFILQDIDIKVWQENQMVTFEVDDLEAYWREVESLDLPGRYEGVRLRPPTDFPWGRELHIIDIGGICWHVRQSSR